QRPSGTPTIRVVCISDTHNAHLHLPPLPHGDILVHAGDLTDRGTESEIRNALSWLSAAPHQHKVFIAGNHDVALADRATRSAILADYPNLTYLEDSSTTLGIHGRSITIYGTPRTLRRGGGIGAFLYRPRDSLQWAQTIPSGTHILLTHGPPQYHRDVAGLGCGRLRQELWRVRPALHVCGHIHAGRGVEHVRWTALQAFYEIACAGLRYGWARTLRVAGTLLQHALRVRIGRPVFRSRSHTLLVNASSMGRGRGPRLLEPIVVELPLVERTTDSRGAYRPFPLTYGRAPSR
ncbi:Metallo-dependent phosphatase-like protein, partial [Trametes gibbosa]